jgi:hypothetical protein
VGGDALLLLLLLLLRLARGCFALLGLGFLAAAADAASLLPCRNEKKKKRSNAASPTKK